MRAAITILLIFLGASGCQEKSKTTVSVSADETKAVLDHHWKAFQANDLEETMADYTEASVLITPDKTFSGLAEIRRNFELAFAAFPADSSSLTLNKSVVVHDIGYILWQATTPRFTLTYGTDTFVIRDGKIISQTYAGVAEPNP